MSVAAGPVRFDFDDYVRYAEIHADGAFELLDGALFTNHTATVPIHGRPAGSWPWLRPR
jgi:hypothetical protein